jgi:HK97 family phage major capsid protein
MSTAARLAEEAEGIFEAADRQNRALTADERQHVENLLERAKDHHSAEKAIREIGGDLFGGGQRVVTKSLADHGGDGPGDLFVRSEQWKAIADPSRRAQQWTTGPVDISVKAGTLLEGSGGQGAGFVPVPDVRPGVVSKLLEPLGIASVFGQAQTTSSSVRYMLEGTATSAAAGVAEGGTKPASDIAVSTVDEPVKKVATVLTVSDELLEDAAQVQQYLNSRLNMFVRLEEERQLLRGAGTNELVGVFGRSGINLYTKLAADDNAVALARVVANTAGSSFLQPDTIIMHPTNWLNTRLLRDGTGGTVGQFYGGGPFTGAYGNGGAVDSGLFGASLWNTRVVLSNYVGAGTALVGNFREGAQIYRRGGPTLEASNSHSNYFQVNLVMLRAESRLALAVYRPVAFTAVSGLA